MGPQTTPLCEVSSVGYLSSEQRCKRMLGVRLERRGRIGRKI